MTGAYYTDGAVTLLLGDTLDTLRTLPGESVNCCVTSPPYFGLRDYGQPGQYGLEATPGEYVERMRQVFAEVRRVLTADGTCWLNLGDSYISGQSTDRNNGFNERWHGPGQSGQRKQEQGRPAYRRDGADVSPRRRAATGLPPKNLTGIPWRTAFALQDDGWYLRNEIVWHKPNAMPESVTDRLSCRHETLFLLTKSRRYWFDVDAIREPHAESSIAAATHARIPYTAPGQSPNVKTRGLADGGANPGDVWSISTRPFPGAHFAVFPPEIPRRAILAGCPDGGTVLDPFSGSATTGLAAQQLGRKYIGIDLNLEYHDLALRSRLRQAALPFGDDAGDMREAAP